jgi:hypothetical protein
MHLTTSMTVSLDGMEQPDLVDGCATITRAERGRCLTSWWH